ncbi:MAG TPA: hypothetical protein VNH22_12310 [Blastocatellia bacterium]|jgi:hypothetical protein|nr:hypothetical protein [Blastocatellia bacterium]
MIGCNQVKRFIDQADNPALLPFEASSHLDACRSCKQFARERASLREMLASTDRVSAPVNFDAMLRARLAERASTRRAAWLTPAFYARFGAAAAVLVVAIMAAQTGGLFTRTQLEASRDQGKNGENAARGAAPAPLSLEGNNTARAGRSNAGAPDVPATVRRGPSVQAIQASYNRSGPRSIRTGAHDLSAEASRGLNAQDGAVVLVRGKDGEREVPMPTVSVGAQSLLYQTAGRPVVSNIRASF